MSKKKKAAALAVSAVRFDADAHKYWLGDKELSGITSVLGRTVFKDKYKGVSKEVLDRAASRGSNVHFEVSMYESASIAPECTEAKNYVEKIRPTLDVWCSEYLISDNEAYASSIDLVAHDGDGASLYDIKTNKAGIDKDYVSWQLSCYAYLFERQNPDIKVKDVAAIWLSDDNAEIIHVNRIDAKIIASLFEADRLGLPFENPLKEELPTVEETTAMQDYRTFETEYAILMQRIKELDELKKKALEEIEVTLAEYNVSVVETEHLKFTRVEPTTKQTFDTKKFKADHPDMVDEYMKTSNVKGYIKVTLK